MNEDFLKVAGTIFVAAITASTVTNIILNKKKEKDMDDIDFIPDEEFQVEEPQQDFMNPPQQPQVEPVTVNVDANGNVTTPLRFQQNPENTIITEPAMVPTM